MKKENEHTNGRIYSMALMRKAVEEWSDIAYYQACIVDHVGLVKHEPTKQAQRRSKIASILAE